jgi:hypothetical protein
MSDLRQAAQQALEALEQDNPAGRGATITALRAALEQPDPTNQCGDTCERAKLCAICARGIEQEQHDTDCHAQGICQRSGYSIGAQQEQEWPTGCPECGMDSGCDCDSGTWRMKEQEVAQQEPVACLMQNLQSGDLELTWNDDAFDRAVWYEIPLYTHPPRQWRGLKEWEINDGRDQLPTEDLCNWSFRQGVYFAEKALKERNA